MKSSPRWMSRMCLGAAAVALSVTAVAVAGPGHSHAKLGEKVPGFELVDSNGKKHKLSDYKDRIVVLEWINPECPWVVNCYKAKAMQNAYAAVRKLDKDVVWLAINTTYTTNAEQNNFWIRQYDLQYPILLDTEGTVGHVFGARRTPHMYVIDKQGVLRYQGAVDDNKFRDKSADEETNYVVNAVRQITAGETVAPDSVPSYGCTVKYKR